MTPIFYYPLRRKLSRYTAILQECGSHNCSFCRVVLVGLHSNLRYYAPLDKYLWQARCLRQHHCYRVYSSKQSEGQASTWKSMDCRPQQCRQRAPTRDEDQVCIRRGEKKCASKRVLFHRVQPKANKQIQCKKCKDQDNRHCSLSGVQVVPSLA